MQKIDVKLIIDKSKLKRNLLTKVVDAFKGLFKQTVIVEKDTKLTELISKVIRLLKRKYDFDEKKIDSKNYKFHFGKYEFVNNNSDTTIESAVHGVLNISEIDSKKITKIEKAQLKKCYSNVALTFSLPDDTKVLNDDQNIELSLFKFKNNEVAFENKITVDSIGDLNSKLKEATQEYSKPVFYVLNVDSDTSIIKLTDIFKKIEGKFEPKKIANRKNIFIMPMQSSVEINVIGENATNSIQIKINEKTEFRSFKNEFFKKNKVKFCDSKYGFDYKKIDIILDNTELKIDKNIKIHKHDFLNILRLVPKSSLKFSGLYFRCLVNGVIENIDLNIPINDIKIKNLMEEISKKNSDSKVSIIEDVKNTKNEDIFLKDLKKELKFNITK